MKMTLEDKTKWTTALRSGEYKQAFGALHRVDLNNVHSFCCMGVLCAINDQPHIRAGDIMRYGPEQHEGVLTRQLYTRFKTHPGGPMLPTPDGAYKLYLINDSLKFSFNQVADLIDAYVTVVDEYLPDGEICESINIFTTGHLSYKLETYQ